MPACRFGFAYGEGDKPNKFIGDALFGMARWESHQAVVDEGRWVDWFFQWAFAATVSSAGAHAAARVLGWCVCMCDMV